MQSLPAQEAAGLSALISHLYDAALDAALWPGTASRIAQALGSTSTVVKLHGDSGQVSLLECTSNLVVPERDQAWADEWHRRDLWVERSLAYGMSRIITDEDLVTPEEQVRSGFYREWLPYLGIHHLVGAVFLTAQGAVGVLGIHRPRDAGAYTDQERRQAAVVLPHLQRALRLGQHCATLAQQHSVAMQALDRFDTGALILDGACRILHVSAMAETLMRACPELVVVRGHLSLHHPMLTDKLSTLVHAAWETAHGRVGKPGSALLVPRSRRMPLVLEVAPLRPASGAFGEERPAVLVFLRDPEAPLDVARLRDLFGLTRTEAAVAVALGRGQSPENIATDMGIGIGTARTHLKRILAKTGTHRQAQLVALLTRSMTTMAS
ncbi:helix-turn-helix transcriptional regulator [Aquincola sp. MAHUQ-54]|uniref:Helix-turn-helix transcriptional regulator n=1 Tax=Aquincola agrisoli TaxID=3119538 RepID=A0AAW9QAR0_9BURK